MYTGLLILLVLDCVALTIVVLLQAGKGGGLAAGFGGAGTGIEMMGSRQTATFLHNATKWLGGAFLVICFVISILTVRGSGPRGLIEREMGNQPPTTSEAAPPTALPGALNPEASPPAEQPATGAEAPAAGGDQPGGTPRQ